MTDMINHPPHYTATAYEPIDIIAAIGNPYCRGNALKYLCRAGRKGDAVEDLKKARFYIERLLKTCETFVPMQVSDAQLVAAEWSPVGPSINSAITLILCGGSLCLITEMLNRAIEAGGIP